MSSVLELPDLHKKQLQRIEDTRQSMKYQVQCSSVEGEALDLTDLVMQGRRIMHNLEVCMCMFSGSGSGSTCRVPPRAMKVCVEVRTCIK